MSPQVQLTWDKITTWLLRVGVFLISVILSLSFSIFNDTKADVTQIKRDVNLLLQYRAADSKDIENVKERLQEAEKDLKRFRYSGEKKQ